MSDLVANPGAPPTKRRLIWPWFAIVALVLLIGGVAWFAVCFRRAVHDMLAAEDRLQAMILVCDLVGESVERSGFRSWPAGWEELERLPPREWSHFSWPRDSREVQQLVTVDFDADLATVRHQTESEFTAIRPIAGRAQFPSGAYVSGLLKRIVAPEESADERRRRARDLRGTR
jgi:hypothetical protein